VAGMMSDTGQPLDQLGHPRQGPPWRREPVGLGAGSQGAFDLLQLHGSELRLAPGPARRFQARPALGAPGLMPMIHGGGGHAQLSRHRGLRFATPEQLRGLQTARFQRSKIPTGPAAGSWHGSA
jgi:hypothetical protein